MRTNHWPIVSLLCLGYACSVRAAPPAPTGPVAKTGCVTAECHVNVKQFEVVHGPVQVNACDVCHSVVSEKNHTFKLAREKTAICTFCHEIDTEGAAVVHEPLKTGECMACHDPHGGPSPLLLKATSDYDLCKSCHDDVVGTKSNVHGPVAAGACGACHSPHTSAYPNLLAHEGSEMCLQCHVSTEALIKTARVVHGPVATDCLACHEAHASDHEMILKDDTKALCESCHEAIRHTTATATTQHGAITTKRSCLNCHEAHASDYPRILRGEMRGLCFECHNEEIELPDGRKLANIEAVLAAGKSLHGPVAENNCAACHQIHGGSLFRLLVEEYPREFYAPFSEKNYALCFKCHDVQLVRDEKTTALTDFRNGDTNLHFQHVNKKKKGRTCRACHETHAGQKDKHIRESVPFGRGGWELPIRYEKTETGGRCSPGCHKPYAYDRANPVVNPPLDKPAVWPASNGAATTRPAAQGATP